MSKTGRQHRFSLAITGASGVRYGTRLLEVLLEQGFMVDLIISHSGMKCLALECGLKGTPPEIIAQLGFSETLRKRIHFHDTDQIASSLASGSALQDLSAGIIAPCSMGTAARIAAGISGNLIERHADVLIKEKIPLVLVPRESPWSEIHLENFLKLARVGCSVVPASPGFYHHPQSIDALVDHVVGKVLDVLRVDHNLYKRWKHD